MSISNATTPDSSPKKNIFGSKLTSVASISEDANLSTKPNPIKKTKLLKDKKPFVGLFNWASYKKETAASVESKKLKKLAKKSKLLGTGAVPPEPKIGAIEIVPPDPTRAVKKKKKIVAANDIPPAKPTN